MEDKGSPNLLRRKRSLPEYIDDIELDDELENYLETTEEDLMDLRVEGLEEVIQQLHNDVSQISQDVRHQMIPL